MRRCSSWRLVQEQQVRRDRPPSDRPESAAKSGRLENRACFVRRRPAKIVAQAVAVPRFGECPRLIERHHEPAREPARAAPAVDGLFRPEEQDVRSGIDDVVPEVRRRNEKVNHTFAECAPVTDAALDRVARIRA